MDNDAVLFDEPTPIRGGPVERSVLEEPYRPAAERDEAFGGDFATQRARDRRPVSTGPATPPRKGQDHGQFRRGAQNSPGTCRWGGVTSEDRAARPSVTVVVRAGKGVEACLDTVRATLRWGDDLVVVDAADTADPCPDPFAFAPARVVAVEAGDVDRAVAAAVDAARGDVAVVLDEPLAVGPAWLDDLLAAHPETPRCLRVGPGVALDPPPVPGDDLERGRASAGSGRPEQAVAALVAAAARDPRPGAFEEAAGLVAGLLARLERPLEALDWTVLRATRHQELGALLGLCARANVGDVTAVAELTAGLDVDPDALAAALLRDAGEHHGDRVLPSAWVAVAELAETADVADLIPLVEAVPDEQLRTVLARVHFAPPAAVDRFAEAVHRARPDDLRPLALAVDFAARLPVTRALEWSARLRAAGLGEECPLLAIAADAGAEPAERVRAAVAALATFDDPSAGELLGEVAAAVPEGWLSACLVEVFVLAPDALDAFVVGAATTPARCAVLAACLFEHEATDGALAVLGHGLGLPGASVGVLADAVRQYVKLEVAVGLAELAARHGDEMFPAAVQALLAPTG